MIPQTKENNFVSIIVCSGVSIESTFAFVEELDGYISKKFEDYEILLVNNGLGPRFPVAAAERFKDPKGSFMVINLPWRHHPELAMLAGADMAIGDFVFEIENPIRDWDFSVLWTIYSKCLSGFDIVAAAPDNAISVTSKLFYAVLNRVSYLNLDLTTEEFRVVSRRALNAVLSAKELVRYRKALYKSSGYASAIISYPQIAPQSKSANQSFFERIGLAFDVIISFSNIGTSLALIFAVLFLMMSIGIGLYAIYGYTFRSAIASGWTTLSLFLSAGFSGIFLILGLLGKYLSILLVEVQNRTPYKVSSISRLTGN